MNILLTDHQVFHKWAQLCLPRDPAAGPVGFLKVDISIIYRGELQLLPVLTGPVDEKDELVLLSSLNIAIKFPYIFSEWAFIVLLTMMDNPSAW